MYHTVAVCGSKQNAITSHRYFNRPAPVLIALCRSHSSQMSKVPTPRRRYARRDPSFTATPSAPRSFHQPTGLLGNRRAFRFLMRVQFSSRAIGLYRKCGRMARDVISLRAPSDHSMFRVDERRRGKRYRVYDVHQRGSFQLVVGDTFGLHKSTVCRVVHRVTAAIAALKPQYVRLPSTAEDRRSIMGGFHAVFGMPGVIGAIDCTHIPIQSPAGDDAEIYRNRKGYFSINVQLVCDESVYVSDVVARWPQTFFAF